MTCMLAGLLAAAIVLPSDPRPSETYAAEELTRYVREMAGGAFAMSHPVVLERDDGALGEDGFRLYVKDGELHVRGGVRGVLYGVYELLEAYGGVTWLSPERTVVPKRDSLQVPENLDVAQKPAFESRELHWKAVTCDADFAARLRLNGNYPAFEDRHGGKSHRFGGGLRNCHTFSRLVPAAKYGKEHPEYFAFHKGRRLADGDPQRMQQLCLTNPDVLRIVTDEVLAAIRRDPTARYFGVSQNDNENYCQCSTCAAVDEEEGSHAGTMIRFVNAVAEAVEKVYPDKVIETLAYTYTRLPPKTPPRHNVMPCLCTVECDFSHPLATGKDRHNAAFRENIRKWAAMTDRLYVWDYTTDYHHYSGVFPNFDVLQPNLRLFRDNGVRFLFEQGAHVGRGAEFESLKAWLLAKWMWNPDLDEKSLLDRFFAGFYGKAAPYVRRYFDELRALPRPDGEFRLGIYQEMDSQILVSDEFLDRARALFAQAAAVAKDEDEVVRRNVRQAAFPSDYVRFIRHRAKGLEGMRFSLRREPSADCVAARTVLADAGRRMLTVLHETPDMLMVEDGEDHARLIREMEWAVCADEGMVRPKDRVTFEESALRTSGVGSWCAFVTETGASQGKALKLFDCDYQWCARLPLEGGAFDEGTECRLRVRVKFRKKPNAPDVAVLNAGVYDPPTKSSAAGWSLTASQVGDGEWLNVELGRWVPKPSQVVWISMGIFDRERDGRNPAVSELLIDGLEIARCERPLWSAGLMTDTHVGRTAESCALVKDACELFADRRVDLVANCGDIADRHWPEAYRELRKIYDAAFAEHRPRELWIYANHDYLGRAQDPREAVEADIRRELGILQEPYVSTNFHGYPIVAVPQFLDFKRTEEMVSGVCAAFPDKPVFVFDHVPPFDTTGSSYECNPAWVNRRKLYERYPRVINLSGHAHGSLRDERNIWQGAFTAVNLGCLQAWQGSAVGTSPSSKRAYEVVILEVYADRLVFRRFDVRSRHEIGASEPWCVPLPFDSKTAPYRRDVRAKAEPVPQFRADATLKLAVDAEPFRSLTLEIPRAEGPHGVYQYRIAIQNERGEQVARQDAFGQFYLKAADRKPTLSVSLSAGYFEDGADYRIVVTPVNFFGAAGRPLSAAFHAPKPVGTLVWKTDDPMRDCRYMTGLSGGEPVARDGDWYRMGSGNFRLELPETVWKGAKGDRFRFTVDVETEQGEESTWTLVLRNPQPLENANFRIATPTGKSGRSRYVIEFAKQEDFFRYYLLVREGGAGRIRFNNVKVERL